MSLRTLINGTEAESISVEDRGLAYGDGLFETIAVANGKPLLWDAHLDRLFRGCSQLRWRALPDRAQLEAEVEMLARGTTRGVVKLTVTRGVGDRGYRRGQETATRIASLWPWPDHVFSYRESGIVARLCAQPLAPAPTLAGVKHLNRLEQVLARAEWGDEAQEGLMQDMGGHVVAGTMSNLFAVRDRHMFTPPIEDCGVVGVMRAAVLASVSTLNLVVQQRALTAQDLAGMDELFVTNSVIGVWPIRELGGTTYPVGPVARTILQELMRRNSIAYL